jgi:hypothetical protein
MPVTRDSDDWKELNKAVSRIDGDLRVLAEKQDRQHRENVVRMDRIEQTQQELSVDVEEINRIITRVEGAFDGVVSVGKLIAWLLGFVLLLQTINTLFGPSIRKTIGLPNANAQTPSTQGKVINQPAFNAKDE